VLLSVIKKLAHIEGVGVVSYSTGGLTSMC